MVLDASRFGDGWTPGQKCCAANRLGTLDLELRDAGLFCGPRVPELAQYFTEILEISVVFSDVNRTFSTLAHWILASSKLDFLGRLTSPIRCPDHPVRGTGARVEGRRGPPSKSARLAPRATGSASCTSAGHCITLATVPLPLPCSSIATQYAAPIR